MAMRKEQVLLLAVLAIALWQFKSIGAEEVGKVPVSPRQKSYAAQPVVNAPEVGPPQQRKPRRDPFWEPSETQPLPPRPLQLPDRAPLSIAAPPLQPGLDLGHAHLVRMTGDVVEGVTIASTGGEAAAPAAAAAEPPPQGAGTERYATTYDQIYEKGKTTPFLGQLIPEGMDKFKMEELTDFTGVTVKFRRFYPTRGTLGQPEVVEHVDKIVLANTLRNEIERRARKVPETPANIGEREKLIDWLLARARTDAWVYTEALRQADIAVRVAEGDLDSLRLKVRVLRQKGDLPAEFELYRNLTGRYENSSFRYEGLGTFKARLGLPEWAENDLRTAIEKGPGDPRPMASLAGFLLGRGRVPEALRTADRAEGAIGMLPGGADLARVIAVIASCRLAAGDVAGARKVLEKGADPVAKAALAMLPGAVDYADAAADPQAALQQFRQASEAGAGPPAVLGAGACLLRLGQWQDAHAAFDSAADQAPLLRDSAFAAKGLVYLKIGQRDTALQWLDRALEADPQDAYALYLRGRVLRELGLLPQALDALTAALRLRDDFLHAIAEVAMVHWQMAQDGQGRDAAVHLSAAARHAGRLVSLEPVPSREFLELQGTLEFHAADLKAAETAFTAARDATADEQAQLYARVGLALCEYARGRTDEARVLLERMAQSLPIEHPMRKYAEQTLADIADHSMKERLEDRFERATPGAIWNLEIDGELGPAIDDNHLHFRGRFSKTGEVWAERAAVLPKAGRFLAVAVRMQCGPAHRHENVFSGLRLEVSQPKAAPDFRVQFGLMDGKPWLLIEDGRSAPADRKKEREPVRGFEGLIPGFQAQGEHTLELRVVPRGPPPSRQFQLLCTWNGVLVHSRAVNTLNSDTGTELHTMLVVHGPKDREVDVRFDDFQLERRKEK